MLVEFGVIEVVVVGMIIGVGYCEVVRLVLCGIGEYGV